MLITMDDKVPIFPLDITTDDEITTGDETSRDLSENNACVL